MAYTPPAIRINGGSAGVKASIAAGGAVSATLDSTDGVTHVEWSISTTDETTAPGDYVLATAGAIGETVTTTALIAGTAALIYVKVNRGVDPRTGIVDLDATTATCKFYVPTTSTSLEVGCAGEDYESDATYGSTGIVNSGVRQTSSIATGIQNHAWKDDVYAVTTANVVLSGAPAMADTDNVTVPNGARLLVGNNQVAAADRGIYVVNTGGAWTRATDADDEDALVGATTYIANGATEVGRVYQQTTQAPITVGVTNLSWARTTDRFDRATLAAATSSATNSTLALRDGSAGCAFSYVTASSYISIGATVASSGALRLANATYVGARNAADSADVDMMAVDNADALLIGDATDTAGVKLYNKAANSYDFYFGANNRVSLKDASLEWQPAATMDIKQAAATAGAGSTMQITAQTAFAGVGGQVRITTGRGALNTDQCGALTLNVGDNNTDSAQLIVATRNLGDVLTAQYKPSDLGMQLTTTNVLGLRGVGVKVDPGDDAADTTNYVTFTAPAVGNWLKLRCDNTTNGTEIDAVNYAMWLTTSSTMSLVTTGATSIDLRVNSTERFKVEGDGARFFGGAGYGTGTGVISVANAAVNPSTNPTAGGILYADAGAGKWRGSGGTVTTFGPADPHCPTCTRDFAVEYENEANGEQLAICWPCLLTELEAAGVTVGKFAFKKKLKPLQKVPAVQSPPVAQTKAKKAPKQ